MHARLWERDPEARGEPAPFTPVEHVAPVDALDAEFNAEVLLLLGGNTANLTFGKAATMEFVQEDRDFVPIPSSRAIRR